MASMTLSARSDRQAPPAVTRAPSLRTVPGARVATSDSASVAAVTKIPRVQPLGAVGTSAAAPLGSPGAATLNPLLYRPDLQWVLKHDSLRDSQHRHLVHCLGG